MKHALRYTLWWGRGPGDDVAAEASSTIEIMVGVVCDGLACMQTWADMEEKVGALQRAAELRSYRMQGINDIMLPSSFGISLSQEPADSPLKAVVSTVRLHKLFTHDMRVVMQFS